MDLKMSTNYRPFCLSLDVLTPLHHFQELDRTSLEYGDPSLEIKNLLTLLHIEEDSFNEFVKNIGLKSLGMQ